MSGRAIPAVVRPVTGIGKLGMWIFLATDLMTFGGLFFAHLMLRARHPEWPLLTRVPGLALPAAMTAVLLGSSVLMLLALRRARAGDRRGAARLLAATAAGGVLFLLGQALEWRHLIRAGHSLTSGTFPPTFFVATGFHGLHVLAGALVLLAVAFGVARGRFLVNDAGGVAVAGLFWQFVDAVWLLILGFVYLAR